MVIESWNVACQDQVYLEMEAGLCVWSNILEVGRPLASTQRLIMTSDCIWGQWQKFPTFAATYLPEVSSSVFKKPVDVWTILFFWFYKNVMKPHWHMDSWSPMFSFRMNNVLFPLMWELYILWQHSQTHKNKIIQKKYY